MSKNYNSTLQTNNSSLEDIITQLNNMSDVESTEINLQDITITPTTSKQVVEADSGYDGFGTVTVNAMPTATQATPTITVDNSTGLITATATQTAGYVTAGTKSATKQLAFQAAKTITPTTTNQTAVAANTYVGGAITIKGDANLVAGNIVSGKSIFGVVGTWDGSGGESSEDTDMEDILITAKLDMTSYTNDRVSKIRRSAFFNCSRLTSVSFLACTTIDRTAFYGCTSLTSISFPACMTIGSEAFGGCSKITFVSFPACTNILTSAFYNCTRLTSIYLMASSLCTLYNSAVFSRTKITSITGSIFVPASLVESYKTATNWAYFSNRIFGM